MVMQGLISGLQQRRPIYYLVVAIMLSVFSISVIYGLGLNGPPIRSDGFGYYTYLPSVFIYHDISMEWLAKKNLKSLGDYPNSLGWTGITKYEATGRYLDKYGIGVALLQTPFFLVANSLIRFFGLKANGYSACYQISSILSGFFYFSLGLFFLFKFLRIHFEKNLVLLTLIFHTLGTGLFLYATYDGSAVPSHIYAFCAVSGLLWALAAFPNDSIAGGAICGFLIGLLFMIRNVDVLFGILFMGYGIQSLKDLKSSILKRSYLIRLLVACVLFFVTISPQLVYWKLITDHWIVYSYQGETFNWLNPHLNDVLFGARKGLFVYYPLLIVSVAGFFWSRRFVPYLFIPMVVFHLINLYTISSWYCWWYGGSFGMRPFVESIPLFTIGFCSLIATINRENIKSFIEHFSIISCSWTIYCMIMYWTNVIPFDGMTVNRHMWVWMKFDWVFFLVLIFSLLTYRRYWLESRNY
jgi:hypothetical protein